MSRPAQILVGQREQPHEKLRGLAVGYDEDDVVTAFPAGLEDLDESLVERLARELEYWAQALRAGRRGPLQ